LGYSATRNETVSGYFLEGPNRQSQSESTPVNGMLTNQSTHLGYSATRNVTVSGYLSTVLSGPALTCSPHVYTPGVPRDTLRFGQDVKGADQSRSNGF
jgi:hypothetical protein